MMRRMLTALFVVVFLICLSLAGDAETLQSIRDSFCASNPNNGWEYGYIDKEGKYIAYNSTFDDGRGIAGWALDYCPGPLGDATINYTDKAIDRYGVHWEPGEILLHVPIDAQGVVVRWTSTKSDRLKVDAVLKSVSPRIDTSILLQAGNVKLLDRDLKNIPPLPDEEQVYDIPNTVPEVINHSSDVTINTGDQVRLLLASSDPRFPGHISVYLKLSSIDESGTVTSKGSIGTNKWVYQAKKSNKKYSASIARNKVQK